MSNLGKISSIIPLIKWSSLSGKEKLAVTTLVVVTLAAMFTLIFASVSLLAITPLTPLIFKGIGLAIAEALTVYGEVGILIGAALVIILAAVLYYVIQKRSSAAQNIDSKEDPDETLDYDGYGIEGDYVGDTQTGIKPKERTKPSLKNLREVNSAMEACEIAKKTLRTQQAAIYKINTKARGFILIWKDGEKFGFISKTMQSSNTHRDQVDATAYIDNADISRLQDDNDKITVNGVYEIFERSKELSSFTCIDTSVQQASRHGRKRNGKSQHHRSHSTSSNSQTSSQGSTLRKSKAFEKDCEELEVPISHTDPEDFAQNLQSKLKPGHGKVFYSQKDQFYYLVYVSKDGSKSPILSCGKTLPINPLTDGGGILKGNIMEKTFVLDHKYCYDIFEADKILEEMEKEQTSVDSTKTKKKVKKNHDADDTNKPITSSTSQTQTTTTATTQKKLPNNKVNTMDEANDFINSHLKRDQAAFIMINDVWHFAAWLPKGKTILELDPKNAKDFKEISLQYSVAGIDMLKTKFYPKPETVALLGERNNN